ncbi:23S rRNA pseudouridine1911/1915/1917 synthase [Thermotomaculum hydrothermale]|uniref:Pseudouridine synthase n=1 Tax=Thermotomaculum hydrothermale TaxID=981385 RepID=A0A7R6PQ81_9BACT|nr:RluA family pseudouridine synthase [Thermotomaculum hydrothermale]BBB33321.1 23S rRNA pseudouridine1911/1915/1917 synthase [Thermotomaculum hydrothermale]
MLEKIIFEYSFEERLDKFLANYFKGRFSRSKIKKSVEKGLVKVNGEVATKSGLMLQQGDVIEIEIEEEQNIIDRVEPVNIPLDIVYEDEFLIIINKQPGLTVHPASSNRGEPTLVHALKYHFGDLSEIGGVERAGIVHRLDKETSGLMVVAKTDEAHKKLSEMFKNREIVKVYKAVCFGKFKEEEGIINLPIGRSQSDRKKFVVREDGREAITHYKVKERIGMFSIVNVSLETGRTHQIRVHLSHIHHPIVGDKVYGQNRWKGIENTKLRSYVKNFPRQALHSALLRFFHPITGKEIKVKRDFPQDIQDLITEIKKYYPVSEE